MQPINYFFASLSSILGLLIGTLLIKIAPEEQKPLGKYFFSLKRLFLFFIFIFPALYYFNNGIYLFMLIMLFAVSLFIELKIRNLPKKSAITYAILGILFFLSSKNTNLLAIESSIVLLYGAATASLEFSKKKPYKTLFYSAAFIIISNLLFFTISHF